MDNIQKEIAPIQKAIDLLKENKKKYGSLISTDSDTEDAAKKAFDTAVEVWAARQKLCEDLLKQKEEMKDDLKALKYTLYQIEEALSAMNPDFVVEYLWGHDVGIAVMPDIYKTLETTHSGGERHWQTDRAKAKLRAAVRGEGWKRLGTQ